jgi:hypothetical protein
MNKIVKVALMSKFGADTIDALMEVIGNTPNAEMATEILLGIHEPVTLAPVVLYKYDKIIRTLVSVDEWNNVVNYTITKEKTKSFYIAEDTDTSLITLDNYQDFEVDYERGMNLKYFTLATGEFVLRTERTDIESWRQCAPVEDMYALSGEEAPSTQVDNTVGA